MDDIDRTQQISEVYEAAAMRDHRARRQSSRLAPHASRLTCEACGKTIPAERRIANPAATRCITCQKLHETGGNA